MTASKACRSWSPAGAPSFHLIKLRIARDAGIVDENIDAAPLGRQSRRRLPQHRLRAGDVGLAEHRLASASEFQFTQRRSDWAASLTSHAATRQPSLANRFAVARPMPAAAPVTMTIFSRKPLGFIGCAPLSYGRLRKRARTRRARLRLRLEVVLQRELDDSGPGGRRHDLPKVRRMQRR